LNGSGDGVFDNSVMFQSACPASVIPARRPTRGSGVGGPAGVTGAGVVGSGADVHALSASTPAASKQVGSLFLNLIGSSSWN
jgi:hypothetical protein